MGRVDKLDTVVNHIERGICAEVKEVAASDFITTQLIPMIEVEFGEVKPLLNQDQEYTQDFEDSRIISSKAPSNTGDEDDNAPTEEEDHTTPKNVKRPSSALTNLSKGSRANPGIKRPKSLHITEEESPEASGDDVDIFGSPRRAEHAGHTEQSGDSSSNVHPSTQPDP